SKGKAQAMKKVVLSLAIFFFLRSSALATSVYDVLKNLPIQRADGQQTLTNNHLFAATVNMTLIDGDEHNDNFSDSDIMQSLSLNSIGGHLDFLPGNKTAIENFAKEHAKQILNILFPDGFAANIMGQSDSQLSSSLTFDQVVAPLQSPRSVQLMEFRS